MIRRLPQLLALGTLALVAIPVQPSSAAAPSAVKIDGVSYPADVDGKRDTDELVVYTSASGTVSPANRWGLEVAVVGGRITEIRDRQATNAPAMRIPAGGVVLSGHGAARNWLRERADVGDAVTGPRISSGTAATPVTPPAPPAPVAPPTAVKIDGASYPADVDGKRDTDELVVYTSASGTVSPANRWGLEVAVVAGRITEIRDRQVTNAPAMPIPAGGVVLSGHGAARNWLGERAGVGDAVTGPRISTGGITAPANPPPVISEPENPAPSGDLVLHIDFDQASRLPGFNDPAGMRAVWNQLAPGHLARSYGEGDTRLVRVDGETVMEARFTNGGASEYIGFRLGEDAQRLNLGHHAWMSYSIWYDPRTPKDQSGKQPGLAAGTDFPSGGTSAYAAGETDVNWSGISARLGPYASPSNVSGLWWRMYAYPYQPDRMEWPKGSGPVQGGEHWVAKKPGTDIRSNNSESDRYVFPTGRWVQVVQELVMNTGPDTKDGQARIYVDGQLVMERSGGFRWYGPQMEAEVIRSMSDPARGFDGFYFSAGYNKDTPDHVVRYHDFKFGRTGEAVGLNR